MDRTLVVSESAFILKKNPNGIGFRIEKSNDKVNSSEMVMGSLFDISKEEKFTIFNKNRAYYKNGALHCSPARGGRRKICKEPLG